MMQLDTIITGDSAIVLQSFPDACIDLTVTSPPYDNLRTYNGFTFDFETIAKQLYRVTKIGGVVVWVVGDATINGSETGTSFKQALFFKECGFNLHDTMIYKKLKIVPADPRQPRYYQGFEYMFVFSKGKPSLNHIMVSCKLAGKGSTGYSRSADNTLRLDRKEKLKNHKVKDFKVKDNVWEYASAQNKIHPAPFPEALAHDHIISWSNEGDTVLDCFTGSGTTLKMAKLLNRHYIGIEMSAEYVSIANQRIGGI